MSMCKVFILSHIKKEKVLLSVWTLISGTQHENCTKDDTKTVLSMPQTQFFSNLPLNRLPNIIKWLPEMRFQSAEEGKGNPGECYIRFCTNVYLTLTLFKFIETF